MSGMPWTEHTGESVDLATATAEETLLLALSLRDPREAEEMIPHLDRHAIAIEARLRGRSRIAVLRGESPSSWLFGPAGFVGPAGAITLAGAAAITYALTLRFSLFVAAAVGCYVVLRLLMVRADRRDWFAVGTPLGAGVVAAWMIRRQGELAPSSCDGYLCRALVDGPEYWHDLAGRAVANLPLQRRERIVLDAFRERPEDLWHLLPHVPTPAVVRAALARGPRSSATADFHAFGALIRQSSVEPVLEAIRAGAGNRDVLIRAVAASGNPAAVDLLIATLSERNERLRNVARDGLIALGPSVLPKLFAAFSTPDAWVQQGIARALRGMRPDAQIEQFSATTLANVPLDESAAADLRRIVLSRQVTVNKVSFAHTQTSTLDAILAAIPAPSATLHLRWHQGHAMSEAAAACLVNLVLTEGPEQRCAELAGLRHLLEPKSRRNLDEYAIEHSANPLYRMVLADEADLLRHHHEASSARSTAETWVDVLERHASLAAVHALDELWRTGVDGVIQTSAMASLMRLSGEYEGLELFADQALHDALRDASHPLYDAYARGQFSRFEQMMISARRVDPEVFRTLYQTLVAQQILWGYYDQQGVLRGSFRIDEDYVFLDEHDQRVEFPPNQQIGVVHPAELGATACRAWAEVFSDYELVPHFEQLQRPARHLTLEEGISTLFTDFTDRAPGGRLEASLIQRGWRPSPTDVETVYTLTKPVQRGRATYTAVIETTPGFGEDPDELQQLDFLAFWNGHHHVFSAVVQKVQLGDIDAVVFSEVVLELRELLATTATNDERSLPSILAIPKD